MDNVNKAKEIDIKKACSFTGHRPERLSLPTRKVMSWLSEQVEKAVEDGYTEFISGMQRGVDIWAAEAVLEQRKKGKNVRLIAACAFKGMEKRWEQDWINRYKAIIRQADGVYYIGDFASRESFFLRNNWMVEHSSRLIAVCTGAPGGTKATINYARKKGLEVFQMRN